MNLIKHKEALTAKLAELSAGYSDERLLVVRECSDKGFSGEVYDEKIKRLSDYYLTKFDVIGITLKEIQKQENLGRALGLIGVANA